MRDYDERVATRVSLPDLKACWLFGKFHGYCLVLFFSLFFFFLPSCTLHGLSYRFLLFLLWRLEKEGMQGFHEQTISACLWGRHGESEAYEAYEAS